MVVGKRLFFFRLPVHNCWHTYFWPNRRTRRVRWVRCNAATNRAKFSYGEVKKLLGDPVMLVVAKT